MMNLPTKLVMAENASEVAEAERSITDKLDELEPDLPDVPEAVHAPDGEDEGWLFDARRDCLEQLAYLKRSQEEGRAGDKPAAS
jgi:hypothetical protein